MLTFDDSPTIRHAILKKLDRERGVEIHDIKIAPGQDCISVGVLTVLDHALVLRSRFELPPIFDHKHLQNEIDEIAEQYKAARADFWRHGRVLPAEMPEREMAGTGLRGRWHQHA